MKKAYNPYSFESFINEGKVGKSNKTTTNINLDDSFVEEVSAEDNPFSFTKLFPHETKPLKKKQPVNINNDNDNWIKNKESIFEENIFAESDSSAECMLDSSVLAGSDTLNFNLPSSSDAKAEKNATKSRCEKSIFLSDDEDIFEESDSRENIQDSSSFSIFNDASKFQSSNDSFEVKHSKNQLSKSEACKCNLQQTLRKYEFENKRLNEQVNELLEKRATDACAIKEFKLEVHDLKKKEVEETAALGEIIQQVEANLKTTTTRAVKAETKNERLLQEMKVMQAQISKLEQENTTLKCNNNRFASESQVANVSQQLKTAAMSAENSLKQLLSGVENLKQLSDILLSIDKFSEVQD